MLAEARAKLADLKARAIEPSCETQITEIIAARFQVFPQPVRNDAEWSAWWSDYFDALDGVPAGAIEAAMKSWVRAADSQFLPKPGELRRLAMATENRDARAYDRARKAVEYQPPKAYETQPIPTPAPRIMRQEPTQADKDRIKRWAAEYAAQVPKREAREFPPSHGATDEKGLTPEMREVMARQGR